MVCRLNYYPEKSPNLINGLLDILTVWRWNKAAFTGDVRIMFYKILVHPNDQVYDRFLCRRNTNDPPTFYQWLRLNLCGKPAPDIATKSTNTRAKLSQAEFPETANELQRHGHVDDIGGSRETATKEKRTTNHTDARSKSRNRCCLGLIGQLWDPIGPCVARSNQAQNRPKRIVELRL